MLKKISAILTIAALLQGCSAFKPPTQTMNITCSEPDAVLMLNGNSYKVPAQIEVKRNRDISIQAHKPGFFPYTRTVGHHLSGTGAADAVGTLILLLPGIGLLTPGAWDIDETEIHIQMMASH